MENIIAIGVGFILKEVTDDIVLAIIGWIISIIGMVHAIVGAIQTV